MTLIYKAKFDYFKYVYFYIQSRLDSFKYKIDLRFFYFRILFYFILCQIRKIVFVINFHYFILFLFWLRDLVFSEILIVNHVVETITILTTKPFDVSKQ